MKGKLLIAVLGMLIMTMSCKKEETGDELKPLPPLKTLFEGNSKSGTFKVKVSAQSNFYVGYNTLYISIFNNITNNFVSQATINFDVNYQDGEDKIAVPKDNPSGIISPYGNFLGGLMIPKVTGPNAEYSYRMTVKSDAQEDEISFPMTVNNPQQTKFYNFESAIDQKDIYFAIIQPFVPAKGKNDVSFRLRYKSSNTSYPDLEGYKLEVQTLRNGEVYDAIPTFTMESIGNGFYSGEVNISQEGNYGFKVKMTKGGESVTAENLVFPFTI